MGLKTNAIKITTAPAAGKVLTSDAEGNGTWGTAGTNNHAVLSNLDYASAGHTGFQPAGSYLTDIAIGDTLVDGIAGTLLFLGAGGIFGQDNANLFWDDTNNRLGLGTVSPQTTLDVNGTATINNLIIDGVAGNSLIVDTIRISISEV